jgi:hypothetical protein
VSRFIKSLVLIALLVAPLISFAGETYTVKEVDSGQVTEVQLASFYNISSASVSNPIRVPDGYSKAAVFIRSGTTVPSSAPTMSGAISETTFALTVIPEKGLASSNIGAYTGISYPNELVRVDDGETAAWMPSVKMTSYGVYFHNVVPGGYVYLHAESASTNNTAKTVTIRFFKE